MVDLEDALTRLDRLTQEEARMALSEVLKITHNTRDSVKVVDGKVEIVGDKVEVMGYKVADVGDKVESVHEKVQFVIDRERDLSPHSLILLNIFTFRMQPSKRRGK